MSISQGHLSLQLIFVVKFGGREEQAINFSEYAFEAVLLKATGASE